MTTNTKNTRSESTKKPTDHKIAVTGSRDEIIVDLVGVRYSVKPPKSYVMLMVGEQISGADGNPSEMMKVINSFVELTFGEEGAEAVQKRLMDNSDDLDLPHIMEFMEKIMELASGNPTT